MDRRKITLGSIVVLITIIMSLMEFVGSSLLSNLVRSHPLASVLVIYLLLIVISLLGSSNASLRSQIFNQQRQIAALTNKVDIKYEPIELNFKRRDKIVFRIQLSSEIELIKPSILFEKCDGLSISSFEETVGQNYDIKNISQEQSIWLIQKIPSGKKILIQLVLRRDKILKNVEKEIYFAVMAGRAKSDKQEVKCYF